MKNFFLGLLVGLLVYCQAANAVSLEFERIALKDLFAVGCLSGTVSKYGEEWTNQQHINYAWQMSNDMMYKRDKK